MQRWILGVAAVGLMAGCVAPNGAAVGSPAQQTPAAPDGAAAADGATQPDADAADAGSPPVIIALPDAGSPPPADAGMTPAPDAAPAPPAPVDECGDVRQTHKVYNGTREPTHVPLSGGQILAIGSFNGCTGTLISPTWVLTASHCSLRRGAQFCVGEDPERPNRCLQAVQVVENPRADMALVELQAPLDTVAPGVEPFAIMDEPLDRAWIGQRAEAAGYGQTERGQFNVRWFTAQPISRVGEPYLTIDGQGQRGVCFGDSGGPVMIIAGDGTVRVAGDLSHGDPSCVGQDNYTRTDLFADWITSYTGPTGPVDAGPQPCGPVDAVGRCDGAIATFCDGDLLARERCDGACGWSDRQGGFRCLQGADPCLGVDRAGACDDGVARWCDNGVPRARDCRACGQGCAVQDDLGAHCVDDPCADLDYLGRCEGDRAVWCDDEGFHQVDCGEQDAECGYVNRRVGYYCQ